VIRVDRRERASRVPELLATRAAVRFETLPWGDYAVGRTVGIERKSGADFARSIVDGRLFRQLADVRRFCERPLMLVEGLVSGRAEANVPWHAIRGALVSVAAVFGVPILHSSGEEESAEMIAAAAAQLGRTFPDGYVRAGYRPRRWRRRALYMLQGLPGVGPARAAALLDEFGSVRQVLSADERALADVRGIGSGVARSIIASCGPRLTTAAAPGPRA